jgi:SAM-dependent methyltransferase
VSSDTRDRLRAAYDANAEARDRRTRPAWKRKIRETFLSVLQREGHTRLLEIGAGTGQDGALFARQGLDVVCVDLSPKMVRLCREKGLEAHVMDVVDLRFPADAFDAVYSFNSLLHLARSELPEALHEIHRVMNPSGLFFLGIYGGYDFEGIWEQDTYAPKRFFSFHTDEHLLRAIEKTFDVVSFECVDVGMQDPRLRFQSVILRPGSALEGPVGRSSEVKYKLLIETSNPADISLIRHLLDTEEILYFVHGEAFSAVWPTVEPVRFMVAEDRIEEAERLIGQLQRTHDPPQQEGDVGTNDD